MIESLAYSKIFAGIYPDVRKNVMLVSHHAGKADGQVFFSGLAFNEKWPEVNMITHSDSVGSESRHKVPCFVTDYIEVVKRWGLSSHSQSDS